MNINTNNTPHYVGNTKRNGTNEQLSETLNLLEKQKILLQTIAKNYFNTGNISNYCGKGDKECSDGSDLYILTHEGIIKIGGGEFNSDTFKNGVYSNYQDKYNERYNFNKSPIPLYVINQNNSYFLRPNEKLYKLREKNPKEYLEKYSVLAYNPKNNSIYSHQKKTDNETKRITINEKDITGLYDTILLFRNQMLSDFDSEFVKEYMKYLQTLTEENLKEYAINSNNIKDKREEQLRNILYSKMGCLLSGSGIYDGLAIKSRFDLIHSFDIKTGKFTSIPEFQTDKKNEG